jgi:orotidine-5'-phosphate decarboxylase
MSFFQRLTAGLAGRPALCVGLDPHPGVLDAWGVSHDPAGLEAVALGTVAALADQVAVFKPQSAFFEQYGAAGIAVLERCLAAIRQAGALSILDVKRGDIGSTMAAYAQAYLGSGPLGADAITVSPYLGFGALAPAIDLAEAGNRGVFVLARTSNPEGAELQQGRTAGGVPIAQSIVDQAVARNQASGLGAVGLVVGGTGDHPGVDLSAFDAAVLVPGIGAQGGTISAVRAAFAPTGALVLPSVSREVLLAGPHPDQLRAAVNQVLAT